MAGNPGKILVLTTSKPLLGKFEIALSSSDVPYEFVHAVKLEEVRRLLKDVSTCLIACDADYGDGSYGEVMQIARSHGGSLPVIAFTTTPAYGDPVSTLKSGMGALAYIELPGHLTQVIKRELEIAELVRRLESESPDTEGSSEDQELDAPPLPGIGTRENFLDRLALKPEASLLVIRADRFTAVVRALGMSGGEDAMTQFAGLVREKLDEHDYAARIEGTAFGILLHGMDADDVELWARNLRERVAGYCFESGSRSTLMTVSIGIRHFVSEHDDPFQDAWKAMQAAFEAGGDRVEVSVDGSGTTEAERRQADEKWAVRLKSALRNEGFRLAFQPIASLDGEHLNIYDVLIRLQDHGDEVILPSEFLPAAARTGLVVAIDRWVIGNALRVLSKPGKPGKDSELFVRLSDQSIEYGGLIEWLGKFITNFPDAAGRIHIELLEQQVDSHMKQVMGLSNGLANLGFGVVLSKFGTGAHSETLLERIKLDYIKVDAPLLAGLKSDSVKHDAIKRIIDMAHARGVTTIASGIEDANTMALLWQLGIGYIQGHYVQEPDVIVID